MTYDSKGNRLPVVFIAGECVGGREAKLEDRVVLGNIRHARQRAQVAVAQQRARLEHEHSPRVLELLVMKAADHTIKIGVVAVNSEDSYSNNAAHFETNPRTGVKRSTNG